MPLSHPPGEAQVDFGQARVIHDGDEITAAMFVMTLPYSDAIFLCAYPPRVYGGVSGRPPPGVRVPSAAYRGGSAMTTARSPSRGSSVAGSGN